MQQAIETGLGLWVGWNAGIGLAVIALALLIALALAVFWLRCWVLQRFFQWRWYFHPLGGHALVSPRDRRWHDAR